MAAHRCTGLDLRSRDRHLRRSPPRAEWPARRLSSRPQPAPSSAGRLSTTARTAEGRCPSGSGREAFSSSALRGRSARSERPAWRAAFASVEGPEEGRVSSSIAVDEGHRLQGLEREVVIRQLTCSPGNADQALCGEPDFPATLDQAVCAQPDNFESSVMLPAHRSIAISPRIRFQAHRLIIRPTT
jgi:hypothetical protein